MIRHNRQASARDEVEVDGDRKELRAFLRARRQHLRPEEVGIPIRSHRRARGLTRDEVAELAGVSIGWYAQFELGRTINISAKALEGIARALRLDRYEMQYLFRLAGVTLPPQSVERISRIPSEVRYIVERFEASPAQVLSRRFDALFSNEAARLIFNYGADEQNYQYNVVFRTFADPMRRMLHTHWEEFARAITAGLRHNYAGAVGDPWFEDLIARLHDESPDFTRFWNEYRVAPAIRQRIGVNLGSFGRGEFTWVLFPVPESGGLQIAFVTPADETSGARMQAYLDAMKSTNSGALQTRSRRLANEPK